MNEGFEIRCATVGDAGALLRIYAPYVRETAVTFEYEVPSEAEFAARIAKTLERYPYLVAERAGEVVGYAYAAPFKGRAAYDWSAELSVYVDREKRGGGVGSALYRALEDELHARGLVNLYACIACPDEEDDRLTFDSVRFHERRGFELVGEFKKCACKFGRWYNMVWMGKSIADHEPNPAPVSWR